MIKHKGNFNQAINELKNHKALSALNPKAQESDFVVTIKDNYATNGINTEASSDILKGFNPLYDATVFAKLNNAGASVVAKVHLDELALGGTGEYANIGTIENRLDSNRLSGGSSSGSAATFTNNISIAIGSDTGDSVRLPASIHGDYGFKPSYGAISRFGLFPYSSSLDTVGYFAHNIEDIINVSKILYGKDEKDMTSKEVEVPTNDLIKPSKIGFIKPEGDLKDYQLEKYDELRNKLNNDGVEVIDFTLTKDEKELLLAVYEVISFSEADSNNANLNGISFGNREDGKNWDEVMTNTRSKNFGLMVQTRLAIGSLYLSNEYQDKVFKKAQRVRRHLVDKFNGFKKQVDALVFPATGIAPKKGEAFDQAKFSYLIHANLSGTPSISIPFGTHEGMPFGLSIDGLIYEDKKLLSVASYIDQLIGGEHE